MSWSTFLDVCGVSPNEAMTRRLWYKRHRSKRALSERIRQADCRPCEELAFPELKANHRPVRNSKGAMHRHHAGRK